jgi:hypothetical protein
MAHGVTQVWFSLPLTVASAPAGDDAMDICSVQPRVAEAHPPNAKHVSRIANTRITLPLLRYKLADLQGQLGYWR